MNVFIIHGTKSRPSAHWQPWLQGRLEEKGRTVFVPTFPTPQGQSFDAWEEVLLSYSDHIEKDAIFVCHSIAVPFLLRFLERHPEKHIAAAFLIGGFTTLSCNEEFDALNSTFMSSTFNFEVLKKQIKRVEIFASKDDPYVPFEKGEELVQKLDGVMHMYENAGHFNTEAGYATFPYLLDAITAVE